jgi:hypothetical protein
VSELKRARVIPETNIPGHDRRVAPAWMVARNSGPGVRFDAYWLNHCTPAASGPWRNLAPEVMYAEARAHAWRMFREHLPALTFWLGAQADG